MAMSKFAKSEAVNEGKASRLGKIIMPSCDIVTGEIPTMSVVEDRFFISRNFFAAQLNHETESGIMMSCHVPDNNSSLLTSIHFILSNGLRIDLQSIEIPRIIAQAVSRNPGRYTTDFLGMTNEEYCHWIMNPDHCQGAIELAILSEYLEMEIIVIDCFSLAMNRFGEHKNYTNRAFLIYDDKHYDPLLYERNNLWWTIFLASDDAALQMALEVAQEMKIIFTLYCPACNALLHGDKEARAHVNATGHKEFE
ncbi:Ubiquitin thioesterase OTU1, partial [Stegodyphus mimosarum]